MYSPPLSKPGQIGMTLIEAIVFMTIIGISLGAVFTMLTNTNANSAQLLAQRQAIGIAEAMMNEVMAAPFTYCDPGDANFANATSETNCTTLSETLFPGGPEVNETRLNINPANRFDNVSDYQSFAMGPGVVARDGSSDPGLSGYTTNISVTRMGPGMWNSVAGTEVAHITITVRSDLLTAPVVLEGIRTRYAPHTPPT